MTISSLYQESLYMEKYIQNRPWTLPLTPDSPISSVSSSTMLLLLSIRGPPRSQGPLDCLLTMSQEGHLEALLVAALTRSSSASSPCWLDSSGFHSSLIVPQGCKLAHFLLDRLLLGSYRLHLLSYNLYLLSYTTHLLSMRLNLLSDMLHLRSHTLDK